MLSTILLVEDNPHIMKINAEMLTMRGYEILKATTITQCIEMLQWHSVDLIVLDVMLPDGNGIDLCRRLKKHYSVPILFLSALGDNQDVIEGLRAGGDDYLAKPYDLEVFVARIEARVRRSAENKRYLCYGCLKLDTLALCGYIYGKDMLLTQKEFSVLLLLVQNAEKTVSVSKIVHEVWGTETESGARSLWTLISRLRKKLESEKTRLQILSQRGDGYVLEQL